MKALLMKADILLAKFRVSGGRYITSKHVNGSFSLKRGGLIGTMFVRMLRPIGLGITPFRCKVVFSFVKHCLSIYSTQGMKGLVLRLKTYTVCMQQALAGFALYNCTPIAGSRVSRTRKGIPRIITRLDRSILLKEGKAQYELMRFWLTLFNLYRVLSFPGKLKLNTITDGFKGNISKKDIYLEIFRMIPMFVNLVRERSGDKLAEQTLRMYNIPKSAPGTKDGMISSDPSVLIASAKNLVNNGLDLPIRYFANFFAKTSKVRYPGFLAIFERCASLGMLSQESRGFPLGKIGFKLEAAGKIRAFAMVDAWSNWCLTPLHDEIFRILKDIPQDGTFDQLKPTRDYQNWSSAYSLDLSAATDRLPLSVQIALLASLYGQEFALNWSKLLVDRTYRAYHEEYCPVSQDLRYSVGQPMGALSSWSMLALTHHLIVQVSAWRAGVVPSGTWYNNYALLGDDIVIGDYEVKRQYLSLLDAMGVECGLHKSVLSPDCMGLEFAKRTFIRGIDVSPIPVAEFLAANISLPSALAFATKYKLTFIDLLTCLGYGYRVKSVITNHVGSLGSRVRSLLMGALVPPIGDPDLIKEYLSVGNPHMTTLVKDMPVAVRAFADSILEFIRPLISKVYAFPVTQTIESWGGLCLDRMYRRYSQRWIEGLFPDIYTYISTKYGTFTYDSDKGTVNHVLSKDGLDFFTDMNVLLNSEVIRRDFAGSLNLMQDQIRDVKLCITNLLTNFFSPEVRRTRDQLEGLRSQLSATQYASSPERVYLRAMESLQKLGASSSIPLLTRLDDEEVVRVTTQIKQIKLWKYWSSAALKALKMKNTSTKV